MCRQQNRLSAGTTRWLPVKTADLLSVPTIDLLSVETKDLLSVQNTSVVCVQTTDSVVCIFGLFGLTIEPGKLMLGLRPINLSWQVDSAPRLGKSTWLKFESE